MVETKINPIYWCDVKLNNKVRRFTFFFSINAGGIFIQITLNYDGY